MAEGGKIFFHLLLRIQIAILDYQPFLPLLQTSYLSHDMDVQKHQSRARKNMPEEIKNLAALPSPQISVIQIPLRGSIS